MNNLKIRLVDGTKVRNNIAVNFVFGGNDKAYSFIPKNEIWIEKAVPLKERKFIFLHEIVERNLMKKGFGYSKAHNIANNIENSQRKIERVI
jgi:hypothetical protein